MTVLAIGVLVNSLGVIAVAVMMAWMSRRYRQLVEEVTELQAAVDLIFVSHGKPPMYAARYDVEYVLDPTKMPPPEEHDDG